MLVQRRQDFHRCTCVGRGVVRPPVVDAQLLADVCQLRVPTKGDAGQVGRADPLRDWWDRYSQRCELPPEDRPVEPQVVSNWHPTLEEALHIRRHG